MIELIFAIACVTIYTAMVWRLVINSPHTEDWWDPKLDGRINH